MTPPPWAQALGLVLFVLLVLALAGAHHLYVAVVRWRLFRAAQQPLPGRTRDLTAVSDRRPS